VLDTHHNIKHVLAITWKTTPRLFMFDSRIAIEITFTHVLYWVSAFSLGVGGHSITCIHGMPTNLVFFVFGTTIKCM
jgi:hypothetical protein